MGQLEDRRALITGASRGIGREVALAFAREGADLALLATRQELLEELAAEVRALGRVAVPLAVDVRDAAAVTQAVKMAQSELGGLDILVNNAGVTADGLLLRYKEEDWQRVLDINLTGAFRVTQAAARALMKSGTGRVINVSSVVGLSGNAGQASYAASKAGLIGFTKSLAQELAGRGVTVNAIAPGFIETDMTSALTAEQQEGVRGRIPLRRFGSASDVAHAALFLASDGSGYLTGVVLAVDGGLSM